MKFSDIGLDANILKALQDLGFEEATPIQSQTIPKILESKQDILAFASTGTGKTAAFSLPIIQKIEANSPHVQAIVLCPTRELCIQIASDIKKFTKYVKGVEVVSVYGGERIDRQIRDLRNKPQIVVGTPGRTIDLMHRGALTIKNIEWLVLDEADEMLDMGFKDELTTILAETPEEKQVLLFSATMKRDVEMIARKYMHQPEKIEIVKTEADKADITHAYYLVHPADRYTALRRIADIEPDIYGIVFCRTKREVQEVAAKLLQDNYKVDAIHGDLTQDQRDIVMNKFRKKQVQVLVATDVAARGIDIDSLTHVINYNMPESLETYVHRTGRTGRAGKKGHALSLLGFSEQRKIQFIEREIGKPMVKQLVPQGFDICKKQLFKLIEKVQEVEVNQKQLEPFLEDIYEKLAKLKRKDLINHFISVEFNRFLDLYKNAPDINLAGGRGRDNAPGRRGAESSMNSGRSASGTFSRFKVSVGRRNNFNPKTLMGMINYYPELKRAAIGRIEILEDTSFFEVDQAFESKVLSCLRNAEIRKYPLSVRVVAKSR